MHLHRWVYRSLQHETYSHGKETHLLYRCTVCNKHKVKVVKGSWDEEELGLENPEAEKA